MVTMWCLVWLSTAEVGGVGFVPNLVERNEDDLVACVVFDEGLRGDLLQACGEREAIFVELGCGVEGDVLNWAAHEGDDVGVEIVDGFGAEGLGQGEVDAVAGAPGAADGGEGAGLRGGCGGFAVDGNRRWAGEPGGDAEVEGEGGWMCGLEGDRDSVLGGVAGLLGEDDGSACVGEAQVRGDVLADVEAGGLR